MLGCVAFSYAIRLAVTCDSVTSADSCSMLPAVLLLPPCSRVKNPVGTPPLPRRAQLSKGGGRLINSIRGGSGCYPSSETDDLLPFEGEFFIFHAQHAKSRIYVKITLPTAAAIPQFDVYIRLPPQTVTIFPCQ